MFLAVIASGFYSLDIYGFNVYYLALGLAIPLSVPGNFFFSQGAVIAGAVAVGGVSSGRKSCFGRRSDVDFLIGVRPCRQQVGGIFGGCDDAYNMRYLFPTRLKACALANLNGFAVGILITTLLSDKVMAKLRFCLNSETADRAQGTRQQNQTRF